MDEGHIHCKNFALLNGLSYSPLQAFCVQRKIALLEGPNFDGLLLQSEKSDLIPIEHTTTPQNPADFILNKMSSGQKIKTPPYINDSSLPDEFIKSVQKKHDKTEGYAKWISYLKEHEISCLKQGILLVIRFIPHNNPLYGLKEFEEEVELLRGSVLLERANHNPSFFDQIYYGTYIPSEVNPKHLHVNKIFPRS